MRQKKASYMAEHSTAATRLDMRLITNGALELRISLHRVEICGKSYFAVVSDDGYESAAELLGTDVTVAAEVYELLSKGGVSPCTLREIVNDIFS